MIARKRYFSRTLTGEKIEAEADAVERVTRVWTTCWTTYGGQTGWQVVRELPMQCSWFFWAKVRCAGKAAVRRDVV